MYLKSARTRNKEKISTVSNLRPHRYPHLKANKVGTQNQGGSGLYERRNHVQILWKRNSALDWSMLLLELHSHVKSVHTHDDLQCAAPRWIASLSTVEINRSILNIWILNRSAPLLKKECATIVLLLIEQLLYQCCSYKVHSPRFACTARPFSLRLATDLGSTYIFQRGRGEGGAVNLGDTWCVALQKDGYYLYRIRVSHWRMGAWLLSIL